MSFASQILLSLIHPSTVQMIVEIMGIVGLKAANVNLDGGEMHVSNG